MKLRILALLALLALPLAAQPPVREKGFAHQSSDLTVDPSVRWGQLDNGLRYAILSNREPKGRASLRLALAAGSLEEKDDQRGLAHFLEHMAFNGSRHYPPGTLVEFFQRLGMSFGGDTNAFTSFDRTVYQLELPDTHEETLDKALTLFSDYLDGLLLQPDEIDKERGIIMSEKRARDSVAFRQFIGEFEFLLPDSRLTQRIPIGQEEVIQHAPRDRFVDFYNTWYRPDLAFVVAVGDFDTDAVEAQLRKVLSSAAPRAPAEPFPDYGQVDKVDGIVAKLLSEPEAPAVQISIQTVRPYEYESDTIENRLKYLPRMLALSIINRRISILSKKEGAPFLGGSVGAGEQFDFFRTASVSMTCKPEQWKAALGVGEQELRRALEFGFQEPELKEAVAGMKNALEQSVKTAPTRRSPGLANELANVLVDRNVFTTPQADLALYGPALDKVTVDDCLAALRKTWDPSVGRRIFVTGNLELQDPATQIVTAYQASRLVQVTPPAKIQDLAFAYSSFGKPGHVAQRKDVADLGVTLLEFDNGVRLNLKPTDFEAGRIHINIRVGGGRLTEPADKRGLAFYTGSTFAAGGLGKHSVDDLQRILAGRTVGQRFRIGNDAFEFGGSTNSTDLLLEFQLLCASVTDPGFRPEAERQFSKGIDVFYTRLEKTVEGPLQAEVPRLMADGDPRFGVPPETSVTAYKLDDARSWIHAQFARAPIEIGVTGDFNPEEVIAAVASTFGALPMRDAKPPYAEERKVSFPENPLAHDYAVPTEIPRGIVEIFWPATDNSDVHLARRLGLLSSVLQDRLRVKIREEMGGTYSPNAGSNLSDTFTGYGFLTAEATVAPDQAEAVANAIKAVAADMAANGVTDDQLERAKQPALVAIRQSQRTNGYWLANVIAQAQEEPQRLDWSRTRLSDVESITAAELSALAKEYLDPGRASVFISLPAGNGKADAKSKDEGTDGQKD